MESRQILSNEEFLQVIGRIAEAVDTSQYEDEDFLDAFIVLFRKWISNKYGNRYENFPFSYLLRKFSGEFLQDILGREFAEYTLGEDLDGTISRWDMPTIIVKMIELGKMSLPRLTQDKKFTDQYSKQLDYFIKRMSLPTWVKLEMIETEPYFVLLKFDVDFNEMLKSADSKYISPSKIEDELEKFVQNYLGVEIGVPIHGGVKFSKDTEYSNLETWKKNVLNKQIKPALRNIEGADQIHSIIFTPHTNKVQLKLTFKQESRWKPNKIGRQTIKQNVKDELVKMGYNINRFDVEIF